MTFRTQYSERVRVSTTNLLEERTHQSFKGEVDINRIIKRHTDNRIPLPSVGMVYADVSELTDYREALDNVVKVRGVFEKLPSASRAYFDNDAALFLDWSLQNEPAVVDSLVHGPPQTPSNGPVVPPVAVPSPTVPATPPTAPEPAPDLPPPVTT